jgi:hypothetical protein
MFEYYTVVPFDGHDLTHAPGNLLEVGGSETKEIRFFCGIA